MEINIIPTNKLYDYDQNLTWFYNLIKVRKEYIKLKYDDQFKKCVLYKTKLKMMLNPFKLIKFSEEQLYFENTSL